MQWCCDILGRGVMMDIFPIERGSVRNGPLDKYMRTVPSLPLSLKPSMPFVGARGLKTG